MSRKTKFDTIFEPKEVLTEENESTFEPTVEESAAVEDVSWKALAKDQTNSIVADKPTKSIYINAKFSENIVEIGYTFLATGEQNILSVSNGRMNLLQGRLYYIPIDKENIDSDEYNIKVHSDASSRFDIRFVRDGLAAVVPILHNAILKTGERLCILIPL
jgi:hypothetical protein